MSLLNQLLITTATCLLTSTAAQAFTVTVEDPTIQNKPANNELFVIDFNDLTVNNTNSFNKEDSATSSTYNYTGDLKISETSIYGGADNSYFIEPKIYDPSNFNITVDQDQKYFGFWWSAGDASNTITFLNDGQVVATFSTQDVINTLAQLPNQQDYYCNPTPLFTGEVCHEPYAFINFFFEGNEVYDQIIIESTETGSNFESDNHTFSIVEQDITGVVVVSNPPAPPIVYAD